MIGRSAYKEGESSYLLEYEQKKIRDCAKTLHNLAEAFEGGGKEENEENEIETNEVEEKELDDEELLNEDENANNDEEEELNEEEEKLIESIT